MFFVLSAGEGIAHKRLEIKIKRGKEVRRAQR
jgi:hypothetical protein